MATGFLYWPALKVTIKGQSVAIHCRPAQQHSGWTPSLRVAAETLHSISCLLVLQLSWHLSSMLLQEVVPHSWPCPNQYLSHPSTSIASAPASSLKLCWPQFPPGYLFTSPRSWVPCSHLAALSTLNCTACYSRALSYITLHNSSSNCFLTNKVCYTSDILHCRLSNSPRWTAFSSHNKPRKRDTKRLPGCTPWSHWKNPFPTHLPPLINSIYW